MLSDAEFNAAYEKYSRNTYFGILRVVNNDAVAEEILQETFLRFLEKADPARPADFRTFLIHISHNLAVDYIKKPFNVDEFRDVLPKTMIGKLSKKELKAEEDDRRRNA